MRSVLPEEGETLLLPTSWLFLPGTLRDVVSAGCHRRFDSILGFLMPFALLADSISGPRRWPQGARQRTSDMFAYQTTKYPAVPSGLSWCSTVVPCLPQARTLFCFWQPTCSWQGMNQLPNAASMARMPTPKYAQYRTREGCVCVCVWHKVRYIRSCAPAPFDTFLH